jgi:hypothetical protein
VPHFVQNAQEFVYPIESLNVATLLSIVHWDGSGRLSVAPEEFDFCCCCSLAGAVALVDTYSFLGPMLRAQEADMSVWNVITVGIEVALHASIC